MFHSCFLHFLPEFHFFFLPLTRVLQPSQLVVPFHSPRSTNVKSRGRSSGLLGAFSRTSGVPYVHLRYTLSPFPPNGATSSRGAVRRPFLPRGPVRSTPASELRSGTTRVGLRATFPVSNLRPRVATTTVFFSFPVLMRVHGGALVSDRHASLQCFNFIGVCRSQRGSFRRLGGTPKYAGAGGGPSAGKFSDY